MAQCTGLSATNAYGIRGMSLVVRPVAFLPSATKYCCNRRGHPPGETYPARHMMLLIRLSYSYGTTSFYRCVPQLPRSQPTSAFFVVAECRPHSIHDKRFPPRADSNTCARDRGEHVRTAAAFVLAILLLPGLLSHCVSSAHILLVFANIIVRHFDTILHVCRLFLSRHSGILKGQQPSGEQNTTARGL